MKKLVRYIFPLALLAYSNFAYSSTAYEQLEKLMTEKKYKEAYDIGHKLYHKEEGDLKFDLLYGKAANLANHPEVAVFPLERVTLQDPNNQAALIELGRSYLKLKDANSAEKIFKRVTNQSEIQTDLKEVTVLQNKKIFRKFLDFSVMGGYDSNANGIAFDFVDPTNTGNAPRGTPSWFDDVSATAGFTRKLGKKSVIYGSSGVKARTYFTAHQFSPLEVNAVGGYMTRLWKNVRVSATGRYSYLQFGSQPFSHTFAGIGHIQKRFNKNHQFGAGIEYDELLYPKHPTQNGYRVSYSGYWQYLPSKIPIEFDTRIDYSHGNTRDITTAFLIRDYYGIQVYAAWKKIPRQLPYVTLRYIKAQYNDINPKFRTVRNDSFYSVTAGWEYRLNKVLVLSPSYTYFLNQSNIPMFSFNKHLVQIGLRGQFNA